MGKGSSSGGSAGKASAGSGIGYSAKGMGSGKGGKGGGAPIGSPGLSKMYSARSPGIEGKLGSSHSDSSPRQSKYDIAQIYSKLSGVKKGDYSPMNQMYISLAGGKKSDSKYAPLQQNTPRGKSQSSQSSKKSKNIETLIQKALKGKTGKSISRMELKKTLENIQSEKRGYQWLGNGEYQPVMPSTAKFMAEVIKEASDEKFLCPACLFGWGVHICGR